MPSEHYDGDSPEEPLPAEHFTKEELEEAANLGDGSPALDPRSRQNAEQEAEADAAAEKTDDGS